MISVLEFINFVCDSQEILGILIENETKWTAKVWSHFYIWKKKKKRDDICSVIKIVYSIWNWVVRCEHRWAASVVKSACQRFPTMITHRKHFKLINKNLMSRLLRFRESRSDSTVIVALIFISFHFFVCGAYQPNENENENEQNQLAI